MTQSDNPAVWSDEFVLARDVRDDGRYSELVAAVAAGTLLRTARGTYRRADVVSTVPTARGDDEFLSRIRATHLSSGEALVFAGMSAAAVWGLPVLGSWPDRLLVASVPAGGGRSNVGFSRSFAGHPHPTDVVDGIAVTSLVRTVVDVGRRESFARAIAVADSALHGRAATPALGARAPIELAELREDLRLFGQSRGTARCASVLDFADGLAESPGESLSRVNIHRVGFPAPELQVPFFDANGLVGIVDFWWPHLGLIGEFDGVGKYLREEFTHGRSTATMVMLEKEREDRLRALAPVRGVARWGWGIARSVPALRTQLVAAGLTPIR